MYDGLGKPKVTPRIIEIQRVVAQKFGISIDDIKAECRKQQFAWPRQIAAYLSRTLTNCSYPEIGRLFGGKHHTSILFAVRKIEDLLSGANASGLPEILQQCTVEVLADATVRHEREEALRASVVTPALTFPRRIFENKTSRKFWSVEQVATLKRLHAAGLKLSAIGSRVGRSPGAVEKKVYALGLKRDRLRFSEADYDAWLSLEGEFEDAA